jgi:hypothetical protein
LSGFLASLMPVRRPAAMRKLVVMLSVMLRTASHAAQGLLS